MLMVVIAIIVPSIIMVVITVFVVSSITMIVICGGVSYLVHESKLKKVSEMALNKGFNEKHQIFLFGTK